MRVDSIQKVLAGYPNAQVSITPTPIYKLERLSSHLGHNVYIMREDLTGFALGGNKTRKLDYLIGDAINKNADTLVTTKASSFSRNAAAAGKVFGFDVHVLLVGEQAEQNSASQALFKQLETRLYYSAPAEEEALAEEVSKLVSELEKLGRVVYELHPGGSDSIGTLGYINAFDQIVQCSTNTGIHFNKIIHSTGSTATQAGLVLGHSISKYATAVVGMAASQKADVQRERVCKLARATADLLRVEFDQSLVVVDDGFVGPGYAIASEEGEQAAKLFATMEGVLLDSVYTGKAAAGLIEYAMNGMFADEENILFVHTGGNSDLFY